MFDSPILVTGKRAIACSRWLWIPGMRLIAAKGGPYPDISDPGTVGCLAWRVRQLTPDPLWCQPDGDAWAVVSASKTYGRGNNEFTAWLSALEVFGT